MIETCFVRAKDQSTKNKVLKTVLTAIAAWGTASSLPREAVRNAGSQTPS